MAHLGKQKRVTIAPPPSNDFWRSGSLAGSTPDGTTDVQDAIFRSGQTVIDTGLNGNSGLTLDDLRSRNSVQLAAGDAGVTDTNMTAIGVDTLGKVRLSNQLSIPDLRATNPNPQDYAAGFSNVFKQSASIGMTGITNLPTYVNLTTTRQYASGTDFSGGQVRQDVDLPDGRQYFRMGTSATTWGAWALESPKPDFDNDLGVGADGKVETGFPLHRNTTTTGAYWRHWANNTGTNPALASSGLLHGYNSNLVNGNAWNTANITSIASLYNGYLNAGSGSYNLTTGANNTTAGSGNLTSGYANTNNASYSGLIGYLNTAVGTYNFISGYNNKITAGSYHQVLGANNQQVSGNYSLLQGLQNVSTANYSFTGGLNNGTVAVPITGTGSLTYGNGHIHSSNYSGTFGLQNTVAGNYHVVGGYNNRVSNSYNGVFGYNSTVSGFGNLVGGYSHTVAGERSVVGGNSNTKAGNYGAMFGNSNVEAAGVYATLTTGSANQVNGAFDSLVAGYNNTIQAGSLYTKFVAGYQNTIHANTHVAYALGQANTVGGLGLLTNAGAGAIGYRNTVQGYASHALGLNNTVNANQAIAIGTLCNNTTANSVMVAGAGQLLGFYGKQGVARPVLPAAATNAATNLTLTNAIRTMLINVGLAT